jgi:hypothetical protein
LEYPPRNFEELSLLFTVFNERILSSLNKAELEDVIESILDISPGALHSEIGALINNNNILLHKGEMKFLKVCIDDAHRIPKEFQICINRVIQEPKQPITWCIAFIAGRYVLSATDEQDDLIGDDRFKLELDYPKPKEQDEFRDICRNLFVARLKHSLNPGAPIEINDQDRQAYTETLGRLGDHQAFWALFAA